MIGAPDWINQSRLPNDVGKENGAVVRTRRRGGGVARARKATRKMASQRESDNLNQPDRGGEIQGAVQWSAGRMPQVGQHLESQAAPPKQAAIKQCAQPAAQEPIDRRRSVKNAAEADPSHDVAERRSSLRPSERCFDVGSPFADRRQDNPPLAARGKPPAEQLSVLRQAPHAGAGNQFARATERGGLLAQ
jgi:hypothetical protein